MSGCTSSALHHIKIIPQLPPQAYLIPCEQSHFTGLTYGDVIEYSILVMKERNSCAYQIEQIRQWSAKVQNLTQH